MKKKVLIGIIVTIIICVTVIVIKEMDNSQVDDETVINDSEKNIDREDNEDNEDKVKLTDCKEAIKSANSEFENIKSKKYGNMDFSKCNIDIADVSEVYELNTSADRIEDDMTDKEKAELIERTINRFYDGELKNIGKLPGRINLNNGKSIDITLDDIKNGKYEGQYKLYSCIFFKDERESGGKGFCQIDPGMRSLWMSRGDLIETAPMAAYQTIKTYPVYEGNKELEDTIDMKNGSMKVIDGIKFVENYLNNTLFEKKNESAPFKVTSVEVLDTGNFKSMGFRVARSYKGIKFETAPSIQISSVNDNYADTTGEVVMARNDQIENFSGLGSAHDPLKEIKEYKRIVSLNDAVELLAKSLGENSDYDIRSINIRYQFVYSKDKNDPELDEWDAIGIPVWKIAAINKQDDKGMVFYVNMVNGEVRYRKSWAL